MVQIKYISQHWKKSCSPEQLQKYDDSFINIWSSRSCGLACVAMVLDSVANIHVTIPELFEIAYKSGSYSDKGWVHSGLVALMEYYMLESQTKQATREEVVHGLTSGLIYIVSVTHKFPIDGRKGGHLVLAHAYKDNEIYFHCPSTWGEKKIKIQEDIFFSSYSGRCIEILI